MLCEIDFDYMDRPDTAAIVQSLAALEFLEAVAKRADRDNDYALTNIGKLMSVFPMDPRLSKVGRSQYRDIICEKNSQFSIPNFS